MSLHRANNAENISSTIATGINIATVAPFTVDVQAGLGATFDLVSKPYYVVLAAAAETETSAIEVMEVLSVAVDTLTISARAINGTAAATWAIGSKIQIRATGAQAEEVTTNLNTILPVVPAAQVFAHNYLR